MRVHFRPETVQGRLLRRFMDIGGYDLSIDDSRQVLQITNDAEWSRPEFCLAPPSSGVLYCQSLGFGKRNTSVRFVRLGMKSMKFLDDLHWIGRHDCDISAFARLMLSQPWLQPTVSRYRG